MNEMISKHLSGLSQGPTATPPSPSMTRMQNSMNTPVSCQACGGDWFYIVSLNKYANMYSATPGGDLHAISQDQVIRICLCGAPYEPNIGGVRGGRTPNATLNEFLMTLAKAKEHRSTLAAAIQGVAAAATPIDQTLALVARVEALEAAITALRQTQAPAADSSQSDATEEPKARKKKSTEPVKEG